MKLRESLAAVRNSAYDCNSYLADDDTLFLHQLEEENMYLQAQVDENAKATEDANAEALQLLNKLDAVRVSILQMVVSFLTPFSTRFMRDGKCSLQTKLRSGQSKPQNP